MYSTMLKPVKKEWVLITRFALYNLKKQIIKQKFLTIMTIKLTQDTIFHELNFTK